MKIQSRSFPYPVLSPFRDDISPSDFDLDYQVYTDGESYIFEYEFQFSNPTITDAVTKYQAEFVLHIEARSLYYRVAHRSANVKGVYKINVDEVEGVVEVTGFVVAKENIKAYSIFGMHSDYGNMTFDIQASDILAATPSYEFDAEKTYDSLKRIQSIFQILKGDEEVGPFSVDLTNPKITIFLSKQDHIAYSLIREHHQISALLIQGIVLPVLAHCIEYAAALADADEPLQRWGEVVQRQLIATGKTLSDAKEDSLMAAQELLHNPSSRFLAALMDITEGDDNYDFES